MKLLHIGQNYDDGVKTAKIVFKNDDDDDDDMYSLTGNINNFDIWSRSFGMYYYRQGVYASGVIFSEATIQKLKNIMCKLNRID